MSPRMPRTGCVLADVPASVEQVWNVLVDVIRVGEWSHECHSAEWLEGADHAAVGARFRGSSSVRFARWSKPCTITELEPCRRFRYRTSGNLTGDATEWTFDLEPVPGGCRVVQSYEILSLPRALEWLILKTVPEHRDRSAALRADLERLGGVAAATPAQAERAGDSPPPPRLR